MKFLAVSENSGDPTPWLQAETQQMAHLVATGVVEHLYLKTDYSGVVLILQAADAEAANQELASLPLVAAHITEFTLTAVIDPPGAE